MLQGLGKDEELRNAQAQQGQVISQTWAQAEANATGQLKKKDAFLVVLAIMAVLLIFK